MGRLCLPFLLIFFTSTPRRHWAVLFSLIHLGGVFWIGFFVGMYSAPWRFIGYLGVGSFLFIFSGEV